jgi:hypothetical protein
LSYEESVRGSQSFNEVIWGVRVPKELILDGAKAEMYGRFGDVAKEYCAKQQD